MATRSWSLDLNYRATLFSGRHWGSVFCFPCGSFVMRGVCGSHSTNSVTLQKVSRESGQMIQIKNNRHYSQHTNTCPHEYRPKKKARRPMHIYDGSLICESSSHRLLCKSAGHSDNLMLRVRRCRCALLQLPPCEYTRPPGHCIQSHFSGSNRFSLRTTERHDNQFVLIRKRD